MSEKGPLKTAGPLRIKFVMGLLVMLIMAATNACQKEDDENTEKTFTDPRNSMVYRIVTIGSQVWFAENLNYQTATGSGYYNDDSITYSTKYGRLYDWASSINAAPFGWHLPTDDEWSVLTTYLGGEAVAGGKLKEMGITSWLSPNTDATNKTGFSALPGGYRDALGFSSYVGSYGGWWSASESSAGNAWRRSMYFNEANVNRSVSAKTNGYSIRCIRD